MKGKSLRNVTLVIGCLMLVLALSSNLLTNNSSNKTSNGIHIMQDSPYGMIQSKHIIHTMQDSPYGMIQSKHIIHTMQDSPYGMI